MKVIIAGNYLKSVRSKPRDGKESCLYHNLLVDLESVLIKDKNEKLSTSTQPMDKVMIECYANVFNGKIFLTLSEVL